MHQTRRGKLTDYGVHLREKQKVKHYYGVLERQFRKYFHEAVKGKGNTGDALMVILERRLDNIVHRLGFGQSRAQARQMIRHGHITVNGDTVDDPQLPDSHRRRDPREEQGQEPRSRARRACPKAIATFPISCRGAMPRFRKASSVASQLPTTFQSRSKHN